MAAVVVELLLMIIKYRNKKSRPARSLILSFVFYCAAILSITSIRFYYLPNEVISVQNDAPLYWLLIRIEHQRLNFVTMLIGNMFALDFREEVFIENRKKETMRNYAIFTILSCVFCLFILDDKGITDAISMLLAWISTIAIYRITVRDSSRLYRNTENIEHKKRFLALTIMGICVILIYLFFLIDKVIIIVTESYGFSFWYVGGWLLILSSSLLAYLGYLR